MYFQMKAENLTNNEVDGVWVGHTPVLRWGLEQLSYTCIYIYINFGLVPELYNNRENTKR